MELFILCDTGKKEKNHALHVTDDFVKAKHWKELLEDQGNDVTIVSLQTEILDQIDSLNRKKEPVKK